MRLVGGADPQRQRRAPVTGWPYSFVAVLGPGRTSWAAVPDAVRLGPADEATAVTAEQLRAVVGPLIAAGHWQSGDADILIVMDAGYDVTRLAFVLADLPVHLLGRIRSDRVLPLPKPPRLPGTRGRPLTHGPAFALNKPATWLEPQHTTATETTRYCRRPSCSRPGRPPTGRGSSPF
ncbi:transposase [Streptosporangium roseum]|uniref:transposase n=1 Tax=Streptosporangium roseum TaxID=2001 RepID=UPI0033324211